MFCRDNKDRTCVCKIRLQGFKLNLYFTPLKAIILNFATSSYIIYKVNWIIANKIEKEIEKHLDYLKYLLY